MGTPSYRLWPSARVGAVVVGAVLLLGGLDVLGAVLGSRTTGALGPWAGLAVQLAVDASLLLVARAPFAVAGVVIAGTVAVAVLPGLLEPVPHIVGSGTVLGPTGAVVFGLAHLRHRRRAAWLAIAVLTVLAVRPWAPDAVTTLLGLLNTLVPALAGRYLDARRRVLEGLRERVERTEREQVLLAEQARAEERRRLAAEMHDVVAHRVSLMVLQAGALEVEARDPPVRAAAAALREAGVAALDELRQVVGVLHPASGPPAASPRVGPEAPAPDVAGLVDGARRAGLRVELTQRGEPAAAGAAAARTAQRIVQEALTNVAKHAPGSATCVHVSWGEEIAVEVRNTAGSADPVLTASGSGSGLRGLAERVKILGGELAAGPGPEGGFAVRARIPGR